MCVVDLGVTTKQHIAAELCEWLHFLCTISPALRRVVCAALVAEPMRELILPPDVKAMQVHCPTLSHENVDINTVYLQEVFLPRAFVILAD